jgi:deoxyadenosine/deoxycytidine kinase
MHIAVAGNIGAGKTTLTRLLAKHFKWEPHFEDVVDNPYLDDFYHQMERWSFNLQIYFLNSRFRQVLQIRESGKKIIITTIQKFPFIVEGIADMSEKRFAVIIDEAHNFISRIVNKLRRPTSRVQPCTYRIYLPSPCGLPQTGHSNISSCTGACAAHKMLAVV